MPSLIDIRRRIRTVRNTQQITKAMKMVSAAKLRRAQERVVAARPYAAVLNQILADVALAARADESMSGHPLLAEREEKRIQLVLVTADRGLAGAFNSNLIKASQRFIEERPESAVELVLVGRKGRDFWRKRTSAITAEHVGISQKFTFADAAAIAQAASDRFASKEVDAVYLLCNEFKSVIAQKLSVVRVLPVELPTEAKNLDFIYEQPPGDLIEKLLPRYVKVSFYRAMVESAAAEQAARMTAMDAATSNAAEVIDRLTLYMNRVRQASITREIIEVVSGAAALE
ncbi:MAG: ATP synthase F1 subunit gamma [Acidobacteria bacterium]|nr:ATP synthase F1 subunit gamma [Acidobacteriota bacterium]